MHYYLVYVAEASYQKPDPLTYSSELPLKAGTLVMVPFGRKSVPGIVAAQSPKPAFATKAITQTIGASALPAVLLRLHSWISEYYPSGSGAITQLFVPTGLTVKPRSVPKKTVSKKPAALPPLTKQQSETLGKIEKSPKKSFLLHGETGSGKTRIYIERALKQIAAKNSVLVLTPEISLVPQLAASFSAVFGTDNVVVLHSGLTKATRNRNWLKVLHSQEPLIIIGTRSALFAPIENIGLIIVDEMHEPAYKQEQAPRYQALRAAAALAKFHQSEIIYGSATPPVVEYYVAEGTGTPILRMTETARKSTAVQRTLVDLRDTKLFSRHRYLSDQLLGSIEQRLAAGEQSLLFLNRRGTARQILCQDCGWQAACRRCDTPLTYHGDDHTMRCHTCGFRDKPPYACPQCGSDDIVYRSIGTKSLVDALQGLFPEARIQRFDTDNLASEKLGLHFENVHSGNIDIIVGTQMLGKGLDLPKLSLVGIVNADTSLGMPDFSSSERSYQLLHQAIGRVGRGHVSGEVIVQSFNPENALLKAALEQNWQELYKQEITERKQFGFPPFSFLLKITVSRKTSAAAEQFINKLHDNIRGLPLKLQVNEPVPSFYERSHGRYNWQLVVKAKQRSQLVSVVHSLPKGDWTYDLDPANLL